MRHTWRALLALPLLLATLALGQPATAADAPFAYLPPGSALPTEAECAARIRRNGWEPVPANAARNGAVDIRVPSLTADPDNRRPDLTARVSGNFAGTTDELRQFYACKWGLDEVWLGAAMHLESEWRQDMLGDYRPAADNPWCRPGYLTDPCPESFGITQVRVQYYPGTWPGAIESTSFNLDYYAANQRACLEGLVSWLGGIAGDPEGCVRWWYNGGTWKSETASGDYWRRFQARLADPPWHAWAGWPGDAPVASPAPTPAPTAPPPAEALTLTCPGGVVVRHLGGDDYAVACVP